MTPQRSNVVFILLDDLGWMDLGCYGSSFYETPNLDALARSGMRFTHAYASCPVCSPTRASILSGKYPATVGVTDYIDWGGNWHPMKGRLVDAPYLKHLPLAECSLATALREGGHQTWHVGKWHLGGPTHYPASTALTSTSAGGRRACRRTAISVRGAFPRCRCRAYMTDHLTDEAIPSKFVLVIALLPA